MLEISIASAGLLALSSSIYLVQHYASPGTSILIKLLAIIGFGLGFMGCFLLPIDLSQTRKIDETDLNTDVTGEEQENEIDDATGTTDNDTTINVNGTYSTWLITYWSTFVLAWVILPYVREVNYCGYFTLFTRMRKSARYLLKKYAIYLILGAVFVIWLAIHLRTLEVVPILMALSNTYGLLLVSVLLGYGLVDFPRQLWRMSSPDKELQRFQIMAGVADEALFDAVWELQDCEDAIDQITAEYTKGETVTDVTIQKCIDELLRQRNLTAVLDDELESRRTAHRPVSPTKTKQKNKKTKNNDTTSGDIEKDSGLLENVENFEKQSTIDEFALVNARLKLAQANLISAEQKWQSIVEVYKYYSQLSSSISENTNSSSMIPKLRSLWFRLLASLAASLSIIVLWTESTMSLPINLSPFSWLLQLFDNRFELDSEGEYKKPNISQILCFQIVASIPLFYMAACVYTSLFKVNFFGVNCLRGQKQSPGGALLFNAQYLIRMQFSLGYNYLLMLRIDTSSTNCAFSNIMSDMSTVPFFGTSFSTYAPLIIIGLCFFTLYNVYPRLLALLGVEHEDALLLGDKDSTEEKANEGIVLLERRSNTSTNRDSQKSLSRANNNQRSSSRNSLNDLCLEERDNDQNDNQNSPSNGSKWWSNIMV